MLTADQFDPRETFPARGKTRPSRPSASEVGLQEARKETASSLSGSVWLLFQSSLDARIKSGHDVTETLARLFEYDLDLGFALGRDAAHAVQFVRHHAELEAIGHAGRGNHLQQRAAAGEPADGAFDGRTPAIEGDLAGLQHAAQQTGIGFLGGLPYLTIVATGGLGRIKRGVGALEQLINVDFAAIERGDAEARGDAQRGVLAFDPCPRNRAADLL